LKRPGGPQWPLLFKEEAQSPRGSLGIGICLGSRHSLKKPYSLKRPEQISFSALWRNRSSNQSKTKVERRAEKIVRTMVVASQLFPDLSCVPGAL
jgi:hypothetical protein